MKNSLLLSASVGALLFAQPSLAQDSNSLAAELSELRSTMDAMAQRIDLLETELRVAKQKYDRDKRRSQCSFFSG